MDNSVYIVLSRQTALFRDMNIVANNIANVDTAGYQTERMLFHDYLVSDGNRRKMAFTQDIASFRDTRMGVMRSTGNALDIAIAGEGYFNVETPRGVRYTRAGNLQLDGQGVLATAAGYPVLDEGGQRIELAAEDRNIEVRENGALVVDGEERAVIAVTEFENPQKMTQEEAGMYRADAPGVPATNSRVLQGVLEKSNVPAVQELTHMIEVQRAVGNTAKFVEVMYDLQRKTNSIYARSEQG